MLPFESDTDLALLSDLTTQTALTTMKQNAGIAEWIMHNAKIPVVEYKEFAMHHSDISEWDIDEAYSGFDRDPIAELAMETCGITVDLGIVTIDGGQVTRDE